MKKTLIRKIISKNGYYDRELLVELMKPNQFRKYLWRGLRSQVGEKLKVKTKKEINPLERIGNCFMPIRTNNFSKILKKMGWANER